MSDAISLGPVQTSSLTNVNQTLVLTTATDVVREFRVFADRQAHININAAATASTFPIAALEGIVLKIAPGSTLNFIRSANETDGNIWVSRIG